MKTEAAGTSEKSVCYLPEQKALDPGRQFSYLPTRRLTLCDVQALCDPNTNQDC